MMGLWYGNGRSGWVGGGGAAGTGMEEWLARGGRGRAMCGSGWVGESLTEVVGVHDTSKDLSRFHASETHVEASPYWVSTYHSQRSIREASLIELSGTPAAKHHIFCSFSSFKPST